MDEKDALVISRRVAKNVQKALISIPLEKRGEILGFGKSGVTKFVDKVAEDKALEILLKENLRILSEECGYVGEGDVFVALDPLDGTFNAVRGIPFYSISLCFSDSEKFEDTFFAYVFNLVNGDEYHAGDKAFKNDKEIKVKLEEDLSKMDAIVYYPTKKLPFKRIRIYGSAALETCFIAGGVFDCFIDLRSMLRIFDVSAGIYIAEKAGAIAVDEKGQSLASKRFEISERVNVVLSNKSVCKKLLELIL
ncbi:MAG: inositol monophosphatase family protein [Archaeoglobaceae archaeon]|nr:inositol monophosphatase [Archaeoglobaceae archaeon]MDW7989213.1 inositol monophosphatase family protein [Archaeoglobaceae archaeon]